MINYLWRRNFFRFIFLKKNYLYSVVVARNAKDGKMLEFLMRFLKKKKKKEKSVSIAKSVANSIDSSFSGTVDFSFLS